MRFVAKRKTKQHEIIVDEESFGNLIEAFPNVYSVYCHRELNGYHWKLMV